VDFDRPSINAALASLSEHRSTQVRFVLADAHGLPADITSVTWDAVILSEVIEHVEKPDFLLRTANRLLAPGGRLLVTIPNGFGPFEIERFFWDSFRLEGPFQALREVFGRTREAAPMTMADTNRHVGFYRWKEVAAMLEAAGFSIQTVRKREWFCGPFSDLAHSVLRRVGLGGMLVSFSQGMADILPKSIVADWMVSAIKTGDPKSGALVPTGSGLLTGWWRKVKRRQSGRAD
jgi:SAM-dependent methyltransferase